MPRAAVDAGAISQIVPLAALAGAILRLVRGGVS
jgi:chemotaxis response regulator CheB